MEISSPLKMQVPHTNTSTEDIKKKLDEHISGKRNWQYHLWDILMFQAWLEGNK